MSVSRLPINYSLRIAVHISENRDNDLKLEIELAIGTELGVIFSVRVICYVNVRTFNES